MFSGSIPALVTPFRDGSFDEAQFRALVDRQIADGSSALVPCGTTGESATMSIAEHDAVVAVCVEQAAGRVPVIAGWSGRRRPAPPRRWSCCLITTVRTKTA